MRYHILHRPWHPKIKRISYWLMPLELLGLVPILVLFGISQPDLYRTKLWQVGFLNGLNSNPNMILYAYANHRPLPNVPFVWSQSLTNFNVAISVISLFVLLTKMIMSIMKVFYPVLGTFVALTMTALYATSVYGQAGPDYADARYPSPVAWYIAKSCDIAKPYGLDKSCAMAKGTFAVTCFMLAIYVTGLAFAVLSMWPRKSLDKELQQEEEEETTMPRGAEKQWEMQSIPPTPRTAGPFTPRTQAFNTLERKLPFRQYA